MRSRTEFLMMRSKSFFGILHSRWFASGTYSNHQARINNLLRRAQCLEEQFKINEASKIYEDIIYEHDPTCKEAYDRLMGLWLGYAQAYGLKRDKLDKYLAQRDKYILESPQNMVSTSKRLT